MKLHPSMALIPLVAALTFGTGATMAAHSAAGATASPYLQTVQYPRYPDDRGYNDPRDRDRDRNFDDRDRGGPGRLWRAGERVPDGFLNRIVNDWEPRGLGRPPGGHQWLRVGQQFLLVRIGDRRIARTIDFY